MLGDYTFTRNSESKKIKGDSDVKATILRVVFYIMRVFFFPVMRCTGIRI